MKMMVDKLPPCIFLSKNVVALTADINIKYVYISEPQLFQISRNLKFFVPSL